MLKKLALLFVLVLFCSSNFSLSALASVSDSQKAQGLKLEEQAFEENKNKNIDRAMELYKQSINCDPDRYSAHYNLGVIYYNRKQYQEAIPYFEATVRLTPGDNQAKKLLGESLLYVNRRNEGMKMLESVPTGDSAYAEAQKFIADWIDYEAQVAAQNNAHVTEEMKLKAKALEDEAWKQNQNKNFDQALSLYKKSAAMNPARFTAHFNIGVIYYNRKKYHECIKPFEETLKLTARDYTTRRYLGKALLNDNRRDEGMAMLQSIPADNQNYADAQKYIVDWKAYEAKLGGKNSSKDVVSNSGGDMKARGLALEEQAYQQNLKGNYEQALSLYRQSLACDPNRYSAHYNIGLIYFNRQQFRESIVPFQNTLNLTPNDNEVRKQLGQALLNDGQREAGMNMLASVPAGDPNYAESQKYIADWKEYERKLAAQTSQANEDKKATTETQTPSNTNQTTTETVISSGDNTLVKDKWALVIGISKFANPKHNLKYAAKDAQDFYNYLVTEGHFKKDHVLLLLNENATRRNIMEAFGDKFLPSVCMEGDMVTIYISTHGTPASKDAGKRNYIVAYDTDVDSLYATGVDMDELYEGVKERVKTKRVLIVMDTCFSGAGVPGARGLDEPANFDAAQLALGSGHLVMTSSSPSERSWESKVTPNGVFTKYLIQNLRLTNGNVKSSYEKLKDDVGWEVQNAFNQPQHPQIGGDWAGKGLILNAVPVSPRQVFNPDLIKMMNLGNVPKVTPKAAPKN